MGHFTLPGRYYTDSDIFRAEMERFFLGGWVCVGREQQVADVGDYFLAELAGESVVAVRDGNSVGVGAIERSFDVDVESTGVGATGGGASGAIRAFFNVCRHRGTRMVEEPSGRLAQCRIRCPYHAWTYGTDGGLIAAPSMGAEFPKDDYPLHPVAVEVWEGHIFLNLGAMQLGMPARGVGERLGALTAKFAPWGMRELRLHLQIVYDVKANWKLIVSNYNECLHCPVLHPALNRLTDYMGADNVAPTADFIGGSMGFKAGVETMSSDGVRRRDYLPGLGEAERRQVAYYVIYPNLLLSLHPDYMMTHTLWPKSVDRTEIVCGFHFHPAEMAKDGFQADDAVAFWDQTNREDWRISELSQLGVSSRAYVPGPYAAREELLWAFDRWVVGGGEVE